MKKLLLYLIFAVLFALPSIASAQYYFGKNKVNYAQFDWQVMTTEHFKIYFYAAEEEVAAVAAKIAEDSYRQLAQKFNIEIPNKTPLIIYSSSAYFSQTNIIPSLLPESVGGFTEFMKGRVVVPYLGTYFEFDHVIRHELVHVFTRAKLNAVTDRLTSRRFAYPPLWFTEGLAEFWSVEWDSDADMIARDMVLNNRLFTIPNMYQINGSYFMYKLGESICHFINMTYGPDKLVRIFENWPKAKSFDEIVEITLGDNLEELSKKWEYYLKKQYFPVIENYGLPSMESDKLTFDGYNLKGAPFRWDDGSGEKEWIAFKGNRMGYSGIYMKPLSGEKNTTKQLIKGDNSAEFESLYFLNSSIDAHSSGKIVFSAKSKDNDVIYIYDLNQGGISFKFEIDSLVAIRSPRFNSDASQVVFSGIKKSGYVDLYLLDMVTGQYRKLTDDIYYDTEPDFSVDDREVVFSSDRAFEGKYGALNLFKLNIATGTINQLTGGLYSDQTPEVTEKGTYFSSDRDGNFNIYRLKPDGRIERISEFATGAFDPRVTEDGQQIVYSGYQQLWFNVYKMPTPDTTTVFANNTRPNIHSAWHPELIPMKYRETSIKYDTDYSFDIAQSSIGYDPVYGSIGGFQAALSDVLGNHAIYFLLTNTAETNDELWESFNFGLTYINKTNRLNWGVGAFHLYDEYFNDYEGYYYERQAGLISLLSYPISKFSRIDLTTLFRYAKRDRIFFLEDYEKILSSNYISWVYDNSLWDVTGPIEGRRYNISLGVTSSLSDMSNWSRQYSVDLRHYFRLGKYSAFANRLFAFQSSGQQPQRIYFGGSWSFRGYSRKAFYSPNVLFASNELRFPLIDNLLIGFPFGGGLGFRGIRGALYFDVGSAWEKEFDQFYGSFGAGFRVALGYVVVLRFDFTKTTDFKNVSRGTDFDFFFGWNF